MSPRQPNKIVSFECVDGNGLVPHVVAQTSDFKDLDRVPGEQATPILVEQLRADTRRLGIRVGAVGKGPRWVLAVGFVQLTSSAILCKVVLVLLDVRVHEQRVFPLPVALQ